MIITSDTRDVLLAAARNNAEWCEAVCRAHGLPGVFAPDAWTGARRTPPLYPDAVTLAPGARADAVLARIDTEAPGCSVKDSFADLDLAGAGFTVLFEARWIHRRAGAPAPAAATGPGGLDWSAVAGAGELAEWEAAWGAEEEGGGLFRPALLAGGSAFLAGRADGRIVAGAVATAHAGVVGVSNLFAADEQSTDAAWAGALAAVADRWPDRDVVGYESGADLDAAVRAGFTPVGPLRVWLR